MPATVPQTEATLLSYFQTNDQPTALQFEELIRTMFYLYNQTVQNAQDAADAAEAAAAAAANVIPSVFWFVGKVANGVVTTYASFNIASAAHIHTVTPVEEHLKLNFTAALADTDFTVQTSLDVNAKTGDGLTKNTAYVQIRLTGITRIISVIGYRPQ